MSVLVNLLPDLRQAKLKDLRRRQLAVGVSIAIWVVCGGLVALFSVYAGGQKVIIAGLSSSIEKKEADLKAVPDLIDALTANQHLQSLPSLYAKRVYLTKFFKAYTAASPVSTTITSLAIDETNIMKVGGSTNSYAEVAKLARALSLSNVSIGEGAAATQTPYFSDVKITDVTASDKNVVTFSITATVSPASTTVSTTGATNGTN